MTSEMQAYRPHLQWVALNTLVWPISNIVLAIILGLVGANHPSEPLNAIINFTIGLIIGLFQWLFLKKYYALPILWSLTIAVGYVFFGVLHWAAGGFFVGLSQYLLCRKIFQKPILWLMVSLFAALCCFWAIQLNNLFLYHGTIYGAVTLLAVGLRKNNQGENDEVPNSGTPNEYLRLPAQPEWTEQ